MNMFPSISNLELRGFFIQNGISHEMYCDKQYRNEL